MTLNSPRAPQLRDYANLKTELSETRKETMKNLVSPRQKENSYYMEQYDATVTVHESPPQQRKQYYDFLEIDDETLDVPERSFRTSKLSKRKNLKVTFSDHIEVDFIEDVVDRISEDDDEFDEGVVDETVYEIPFDRTKGLKQITSSAEFKTVTENISPTNSRTCSDSTNSAKSVIKSANNSIKPTKCQHQIQAAQQMQQPLLHKRREPATRVSLSDLEKKTKQFIEQMHEKNKKAETQARVAKALFPDITSKVKSQPTYKQFIANAKRAVEITRRYERPWANGSTATQSTFSVWKKRSETIRRTASLPKNFKLPDELIRKQGSDHVILNSGNRLRIRNS